MDVAVVIPAYNPPPIYLDSLLASLAAQTVQPKEVVIVDDGSLVPLAGLPVRVVRQENGGVAAARNRGIRETTAEIVHICDQDELLEPSYYETLLPAFRDPTVGVAFAAMRGRVDDVPADWTLPPPGMLLPDDATTELIRYCRIGSSGAIFRRSLWEELGGYADYQTVQDWHFWIRASQVCRFHQEPQALAWHRRHSGQLTAEAHADSLLMEEIAMLRDLDLPVPLRRVRQESVAHRWLRVAEVRSGIARRTAAVRAIRRYPRSALSLALRP